MWQQIAIFLLKKQKAIILSFFWSAGCEISPQKKKNKKTLIYWEITDGG
jgi:hypothetical protein